MARVDTLEEAQVLARAVQSGAIPAEQQQEAMDALRTFQGEDNARREFTSTKLQSNPQEGPEQFQQDLQRQFASDEDREEFFQNAPSVKSARAAAKGVNVHDGIDPAIRAKVGLLNFNPKTAAFVMDELIRSNIPAGEVPRGIPTAANIEGVPSALTRQEDGSYRYHAIDPVGIDAGDLAEFSGELPQLAAEVAGGVGGALGGGAVGNVPGAIVGSAAGSGAGAALSLDARVWLAKKFGVPEELVDDAVTNDIRFREALIAAGGDLLTAGALGTVRAVSNARGGRILSKDQVEQMMPEVEKSLKQAGEFKDRTGQELPLTMGQLTGDTDILQAEKILQGRAKGRTSQELSTDAANRDRAVNDALRDITEDRIRTPDDARRSVEEVTEDVTTGVRGEAEEARRLTETAQEDLDEFTSSMDEAMAPDTFVRTRDQAFQSAEDARVAERKAWDTYRKEVEWKQGQGSNVRMHSPADGPIKNALLEMDEDAGRALLQTTQKAQSKFIADAGLPDEGPTTGLAGEFLDPRELHFTLSDLKRRVRAAERGVDPDGFRVADMRKVIDAIEETIETAPMSRVTSGRAVRPEKAARIRESFRLASDTTLKAHSLFDGANMRALLEINPRTGEPNMPAGMMFKRLFAEGDARFLGEALEAVDQNPATKAALGEELLKKHRNATRTDASGDAHRRFMDAHFDHIQALGLNPDTIRGAGGLARAVRQAQDKATRLGERLARTFGKRLSDETTDVTNIAKEMRQLPAAKAKNVIQFLERTDPALADAVRDHSLLQIRRELATKGDTAINFDGLWKTLDEQSETLAALHGRQYVEDLRLMKRTQQLISREKLGKSAKGQNVQPGWLDITRSIMGPLSKKQRFLTAVQRNSRRVQARGARTVIGSPEDLRKFVKLKNKSPAEVARNLSADNLLGTLPDDDDKRIHEGAAKLGQRIRPTGDETAGSSIVPGRPSPAEAVGGTSPQSSGDVRTSPEEDLPPGIQTLMRHEGFDQTIRRDLRSNPPGARTIGFGRNIDANPITPQEYRDMGTTKEQVEQEGINREQAQILFASDYADATRTAAQLPGWTKLDAARKDVLINMAYNLGAGGLRGFKKMIAALAVADYDKAAAEMLDSRWATQVGPRASELATVMRTGQAV